MNGQNQIRPVLQAPAPPPPQQASNALGSYYVSTTRFFAEKNILIITLVILLALSLLGINILTLLGSGIQYIVNWIGPYISKFLFNVSDTTGAVINKTSDVVSNTTKVGIDIADGSVHSLGNIMRNTNNINPTVGENPVLSNLVNVNKTSIPVPQVNPNAGVDVGQPQQSVYVQVPVAVPVPSPSSTVYVPVPSPSTPVYVPAPYAVPTPYAVPAPVNLDEVLNKSQSKTNGWCFVGEYNGDRNCVSVTDQDKCMSGQIFPSEQKCLKVKTNGSVSYNGMK
jgi:hypothetical protein